MMDWVHCRDLDQPAPQDWESTAERANGTQLPVHLTVARIECDDGPADVVYFTDSAAQELHRHMEDLTALNTVASVMDQSSSPNALLQAALGVVLGVLHINTGLIHLLEPRSPFLTLQAHEGLPDETAGEKRTAPIQARDLLAMLESGRPAVLEGATRRHWASALGLTDPASILAIPLRAREETIGVMTLLGCGPRTLEPQGLQFVAALGHQIGAAVANARLAENAAEVQVLRELDRLRSELIANVSHELRTPLGLIKLFCTNLMRQDVRFPESEQFEFLGEIDKEVDRLQSIVDNLLDLSRIQNGQIHLRLQTTDLAPLIDGILASAQAQNKSHRFSRKLESPLEAVVDAKRVEQVLRNLVTNAVKYSPAGGMVTVRGTAENGRILIQVSDQGVGIPEADLQRVFERFFRADNIVTRRVGGIGLGLSICKGIVEAHGGKIWGESIPGVGTTFSFTLPQKGAGGRPTEFAEASDH